MPVIRREVRKAIDKAYPEAKVWGKGNQAQHAAFQCMWLQYDHVLPRSKGGDNSPANVVVACAPCNYGRSELTLDEIGVIDPRGFPILKTSWDGLERFMSAR
jgi:5-methylcytosine-specific restriction endonuclease McrA